MILWRSENAAANALIAQLDRASGYGPEGREFESSSARHNKKPAVSAGFSLFMRVFSLHNCKEIKF